MFERRVAEPLLHIEQLRSRYAWPLIAVTILMYASFMVVLGFVSRPSPKTTASASAPTGS